MKNNQHGHNVHYVNNNFHLNATYPAYNNNNSSNNNNGNVKTNSNNNNNSSNSYNRPLNQNQYQPKGSTTQMPTTPGIIGYVPTMAKNVNSSHRSMNNTNSHAKHVYSNMNQQQAKQSDQPLHHLTNYQHHTQTTTSPTSTTALQTSYVNSNSGNYASLERKNSYPFNHKQHHNSNHPHSHHHHHHQQQQQQHYQHGNNHQHHQHHTHHAYQKQTSLQENSRKSVNTLFSSPSFSNEPLSTQPPTQQQELSHEQVKEQKLKDQEQINSIVDYLHRVDLNSKQSLMVPPSSNNESVSSSSNNIETSDCESYENEYPTASMSSINIANTATATSISSTPPTTSITTTRTSAASNNDLNEVFTNDDDNDDDVHIVDVDDLVDQSSEETQSFDTIKLKDLVNQTDYVNRFKYYSDYVMAVDRLYPNTKWPLHDSWTFWYFKNDSNLSWEDNLNKLIEVAYIEDFWSVVNYVYSPSRITSHGDIIFFKNGIRPMWEDLQNSDGGSWLFQIQAGGQQKKSNEEIFQYWLDTMLSLIGDCFCDNELQKKYDLNGELDRKNVTSDEHLCEYISGFYASPRTKMHKLALWTRSYKNEKKTRLIG